MRQQDFQSFRANLYPLAARPKPNTPSHFQKNQKPTQKLESLQNLTVNNQKLERELAIYDWRSKTQFPIVKISHCKVLQKRANTTVLQIKNQKYCLKLKNCRQLPLFKVLYLLKQSIIGFQRLYNKFGPFVVTSSMVAINNIQKCKVWVNENFASNQLVPRKRSEANFLSELFRLFQQRSNNLKNTCQFFLQLQNCATFCEALNFIDLFTKENRIVISSSCKLTAKELVLEDQKEENFDFFSSLKNNKVLDFLPFSGLRISLNTTSESPFKKVRGQVPVSNAYHSPKKDSVEFFPKTNKTEDTGDGSYINSSSNNEHLQKNDRNHEFTKQEDKETIYKSQLQKQVNGPQNSRFFVRKYNSYTVDLNQFEKLQFNTQKTVSHFEKYTQPKIKTEIKTYGHINDQEDEQKTRNNIQIAFQKNQWNKRLNDLWQQQVELTHSIVHTQQKAKLKLAPLKLQLLGKINNNVYQSFINTENNPCSLQQHSNQY